MPVPSGTPPNGCCILKRGPVRTARHHPVGGAHSSATPIAGSLARLVSVIGSWRSCQPEAGEASAELESDHEWVVYSRTGCGDPVRADSSAGRPGDRLAGGQVRSAGTRGRAFPGGHWLASSTAAAACRPPGRGPPRGPRHGPAHGGLGGAARSINSATREGAPREAVISPKARLPRSGCQDPRSPTELADRCETSCHHPSRDSAEM